MDEQEWLTSTHLERLYSELKRGQKAATTKAGRRRFRLLACGCCRCLLWHLPLPDSSRRAVEAAEAFADDVIGWDKMTEARMACRYSPFPKAAPDATQLNLASNALVDTTGERAAGVTYRVTSMAVAASGKERRSEARKLLCELMRDIFGNPFRPLLPLDPAWLAWQSGTVRRLALAVYDGRDFGPGPMGILADALEDAGCTEERILEHVRSKEKHVRGCWAVDAVLGRT